MAPLLQPKYDAVGKFVPSVTFDPTLMVVDGVGSNVPKEELERQEATVSVLLFPLVVKKGSGLGVGDEQVVVYPAHVVLSREFHGEPSPPGMSTADFASAA